MKPGAIPPARKGDYAYREVCIFNLDTGEYHCNAPYTKTDAEAIELTKLTYCPSRWEIVLRRDIATKRAACSKCGQSRILAYGCSAMVMTFQYQLKILVRIGWEIAPRFLCRHCWCPLTLTEQQQARRLFSKVKFTNPEMESAQFYLDEFKVKMAGIYGMKVFKWFDSLSTENQKTYG